MKFTIKQASDGQYYFILIARNGKTVATSEMYKTKASCRKGIASVMKVTMEAQIIDNTI